MLRFYFHPKLYPRIIVSAPMNFFETNNDFLFGLFLDILNYWAKILV